MFYGKESGGFFVCRQNIAGGFECPACGNHVCEDCAKKNGGLCPHCLSRLYRIS